MNAKVILANAQLAFMNKENETALDLAKQAINLEPKNPHAYKIAASACMSMGQYDDAVKKYTQAANLDSANGNRYFDLGFAYASQEKTAEAMKSFTRAEELGCAKENLIQLYRLLGILCYDIGRYDDALINLSKAEQIVGIDLDILRRKAVIYGLKRDFRNGLHTANQIKLVAPSEYIGYKIAFRLLIQAKRLDVASKELYMAGKYSSPSMDYFFDAMTLELERYNADKNKEHFDSALSIIDKALKRLKPTMKELIDTYINAAEINLQLEKADKAIACLYAAQNPISSFNNRFDVAEITYAPIEISEYDVEEMIEADRARIADELGDSGLEELVERTEPDENGNRDYFTEIQEDEEKPVAEIKLDEADVVLSKSNVDQINRLFIGAYTLKKDYDKVIVYARKLQSSERQQNNYIGMYTEANALKALGSPDAEAKYHEIIKAFRNAMIKDPSDLTAVTFRIQSNMDIGQYDEAEQLCNLLAKEVREPLLKRLEKAKLGGE